MVKDFWLACASLIKWFISETWNAVISYFHKTELCLILKNIPGKFRSHFGELPLWSIVTTLHCQCDSVWWIVYLMNSPFDELSIRWTVHSINRQRDQLSLWELSTGYSNGQFRWITVNFRYERQTESRNWEWTNFAWWALFCSFVTFFAQFAFVMYNELNVSFAF